MRLTMSSTEPELRSAGPLRVAGFNTRTSNPEEMAGAGRIGEVWQTLMRRSSELKKDESYGVYYDYESDHMGPYSLHVGHVLDEGETPPEGWEVIEVQAEEFLVFPVPEGQMPLVLIATWQQIWGFFDEDCAYERTFRRDFERHGDAMEVYVSVRRRS